MFGKSWTNHACDVLKVVFALILIYASIPLAFYLQPDLIVQMFFQSEGISAASFEPSFHQLPGHNIYIKSNNGLVPVWVLGKELAIDNLAINRKFNISQRVVVFFLHGIKYNRYDNRKLKIYQFLIELGAVVVTLDYRGFSEYIGDADGNVAVEDAITVYRWLEEQFEDERVHKVWWGHSAGCGIAVEALIKGDFKVNKLIFESGFASMKSLMLNKGSIKMLFGWWMPYSYYWVFQPVFEKHGILFENYKNLRKINASIYHIHSYNDNVVPIEEALMINQTMHEFPVYHPSFLTTTQLPESHYISTYEQSLFADILKDHSNTFGTQNIIS